MQLDESNLLLKHELSTTFYSLIPLLFVVNNNYLVVVKKKKKKLFGLTENSSKHPFENK